MLTEAALLALISHRAVGNHPAITSLLESISDCTIALNRIYEIIRWHPYLWTSIGLVWVILDKFSLGDTEKRERLRILWNGDEYIQPRERVPYRLLDQAWLRSIAKGNNQSYTLLTSLDLRSCSSFGNVEGGLFMGTSDLYALTHTPMYVTDFGSLGRTSVEPGWIGSLGLSRLLINDFDLAGELAIADILTQQQPDIGTVIIAGVLNSIFEHLGFIPSPTFRDQAYREADVPSDYLLFHTYHSTFVYGLFSSVVKVLQVEDENLSKVMSFCGSTFPTEWSGRQLNISKIADQVVHTQETWFSMSAEKGIILDRDRLLRSVIDTYLLDAVTNERTDELLSLIGMSKIAGSSQVDQAARKLLSTRAYLSGEEEFSKCLQSLGNKASQAMEYL